MSRPIPPLNALRAFEATARHASFTRAAAELHVTPAALSHQIRGLEDYLGHKLFHRKARTIALTPAGDLIYPGLNAAFTQVRQTMDLLDQSRDDRILVVSTPPGFTAKWLAPRLYRFLAANPEIDTRISSTQAFANFTTDGVDVAIRNAHAPFPGLFSERLFAARMLPVLSPRLLSELGGLATPQDLKRVPIIHDESLIRLADWPKWSDWFRLAGVDGDIDANRGLRFNSADHALEATIEGAGVLLAHKALAYDDLRTGRLVAPFEIEATADRAFHLVCPSGHETRPKISAFRAWIRDEVDRLGDAI
jgi:LysR family transcriptional regulator, glycine cleavage system transcriptional activator